jgi:hypothetical protein
VRATAWRAVGMRCLSVPASRDETVASRGTGAGGWTGAWEWWVARGSARPALLYASEARGAAWSGLVLELSKS